MKHKFDLHQELDLLKHPGYFGKVIFIDLYGGPNRTPRYLLDCSPGACGGYIWCICSGGYGPDNLVAANWFNEDELKEQNDLQM